MDIETFIEACYSTVYSVKDKPSSEVLDTLRINLEPYVYNYLIQKYGPALDEWWKTYTPPKKARGAFVIVERRIHPNAWFILRNMAWANAGCSVYIFCSDENKAFFETLLGPKLPHVHLIEWFKGSVSREEGKHQYNLTFKAPLFYSSIDAEYICTVQMDCFFRRQFTDELWKDDYWGAPWGWAPDDTGGGGITIRKISTMLKVCELDPHKDQTMVEDCWIGIRVKQLGYKYPSFEERASLISENVPSMNPIGVHQFWTFITNFFIADKQKFSAYIHHVLKINM
jgi:hypothetical protein